MDKGESPAKRGAGRFYGQNANGDFRLSCILTGARNPDWHHLNETHDDWRYENIVPVSQNINQSIERQRRLPNAQYDATISPGFIEGKSREHFEAGSFKSGYACARLGASLTFRPSHPDGYRPDHSLTFYALALRNLRPISAISLAADTLAAGVLPILLRENPKIFRVDGSVKALLALEIGSYFRDYGLPVDDLQYLDLADRWLGKPKNDDQRRTQVRMASQRAFVFAAVGSVRRADYWFDKAFELNGGCMSYPEGTANFTLHKIRMKLALGECDLDWAEALIIPLLQRPARDLKVTAWTSAELLATLAEIQLAGGKPKRGRDLGMTAWNYMRGLGILPLANNPSKILLERYAAQPADRGGMIVPRSSDSIRHFAKQADMVLRCLLARK